MSEQNLPQREVDLWFHTETEWQMAVTSDCNVLHSLQITVLNPHKRSLTERLSIGFPSGGISEVQTEVNGRALPSGFGYNNMAKRYSLELAHVQEVTRDTKQVIKCTFKQQDAVCRLPSSLYLVTIPLQIELAAAAINATLTLPPLNGWKKWITLALKALQRKQLYTIDEVNLPPVSPRASNIDYAAGKIQYHLGDTSLTLGFVFQGYTRATLATLIVGVLGLVYALIRIVAAFV